MAVGARNVHAIDRAVRRALCVCERPLPTSDDDPPACLKCGRPLFDRFEEFAPAVPDEELA